MRGIHSCAALGWVLCGTGMCFKRCIELLLETGWGSWVQEAPRWRTMIENRDQALCHASFKRRKQSHRLHPFRPFHEQGMSVARMKVALKSRSNVVQSLPC